MYLKIFDGLVVTHLMMVCGKLQKTSAKNEPHFIS
jgi:hypothetical protein